MRLTETQLASVIYHAVGGFLPLDGCRTAARAIISVEETAEATFEEDEHRRRNRQDADRPSYESTHESRNSWLAVSPRIIGGTWRWRGRPTEVGQHVWIEFRDGTRLEQEVHEVRRGDRLTTFLVGPVRSSST